MARRRPKVVAMGGGTGCPAVLAGLRPYPLELTAIVTTMDSGGSSGRLRLEFGVAALGDLRRALAAMADPAHPGPLSAAASEHRFTGDSPLAGHTLGNLLLLALHQTQGGLEGAVGAMARLLGSRGAVLPATLEPTHLFARLQDDSLLEGEAAIDQRGASPIGLAGVYLAPPVEANPRALGAIAAADAVVLGPGDLYTSLLPNILPNGMAEALADTRARLVHVANLATKPGETDGYRLSDFLRVLLHYLGRRRPLDAVVLDTGESRQAHTSGGRPWEPVAQDLEACRGMAERFVAADVARTDAPWLHDPARTAAAVLEAAGLATLVARPTSTR